jgi:tetratricopeptide (TPR) repeat protein
MGRIPEAQRTGDYYLARADMLDSAGSTEAAASDLERALRANPERAGLYHRSALFLIRHGRLETALELLDRASRILPDDPSIMLLRATVLELAHQTEAAEHLLAQMESRWPEWSEPCVVYGILLATHERFPAARRRLETALALGADDAVVWYYLAKSTWRAAPGEIDSARKQIERAVELAPGDPAAHALAGRIAFEQKQYDRASEQLREAIRLRPQFVEAHADLAKTYGALGRKQEERGEMEQVRQIRERYPNGEPEAAGADALLAGQDRPN